MYSNFSKTTHLGFNRLPPELPRWFSSRESTYQCKRHKFDPWAGKIPWRRKWQPTPVFLPGQSQGQRNLVSYSPWCQKRVGHNLVTKQQQQNNPSSTLQCDGGQSALPLETPISPPGSLEFWQPFKGPFFINIFIITFLSLFS